MYEVVRVEEQGEQNVKKQKKKASQTSYMKEKANLTSRPASARALVMGSLHA